MEYPYKDEASLFQPNIKFENQNPSLNLVKETVANLPINSKQLSLPDIITLLYLFKSNEPDATPINAYFNPGLPIQDYLNEYQLHKKDHQLKNPYAKIQSIAPDIVMLFNQVARDFKAQYLDVFNRKFSSELVLPLIASFRLLTDTTGRVYTWQHDPFQNYAEVQPKLFKFAFSAFCDISDNTKTVLGDELYWQQLSIINTMQLDD